MDPIEKRNKREERKELKQRRKEYAREEKESVKRQKRALKEKRKAFRNEKRENQKLFNPIQFLTSLLKPVDKDKDREGVTTKHRQKEFIKNETKSLAREKREMKIKMRPMRRKIRQARWGNFKRQTILFFNQPFKRKEKSEAEVILREQVRYEIKKMTLRKIYRSPFEAVNSIGRFWNNRRLRIKSALENVENFIYQLRYIFKVKEIRGALLKTLVNSTIMFVLSFLVIYFLGQFITVFIASVFDIPSVVFANRIYWPLYTYSSLYSRMALVAIFGSGPFFSLLLGAGLFRLFFIAVRKTVHMKTFLLWAALHSFNLFFGAYIVGVITRTGFIYSSEWLFLSDVLDVEEIVFLIVSMVVLVIAGYFSTKYFLQSANSSIIIEKKIRKIYVSMKVGLPWIFGSLILFGINAGKAPTELLILYVTPILIIIPVFANFNSMQNQFVKAIRPFPKFGIAWGYLIALVLFVSGIILLLKDGISFS